MNGDPITTKATLMNEIKKLRRKNCTFYASFDTKKSFNDAKSAIHSTPVPSVA